MAGHDGSELCPRALLAGMKDNANTIIHSTADPFVRNLADEIFSQANQLETCHFSQSNSASAFDFVTPSRTWIKHQAVAAATSASAANHIHTHASDLQDPSMACIVTPPEVVRATAKPSKCMEFMPISQSQEEDDISFGDMQSLSSSVLGSASSELICQKVIDEALSIPINECCSQDHRDDLEEGMPPLPSSIDVDKTEEDTCNRITPDMDDAMDDAMEDAMEDGIGILKVFNRSMSDELLDAFSVDSRQYQPQGNAQVTTKVVCPKSPKRKHHSKPPASSKRKKSSKSRKAKYLTRMVANTNQTFEEYIEQDGIDGNLICLGGKGAHNKEHVGNKQFHEFTEPYLPEYNAKATSKDKEKFTLQVLEENYDQRRRFFWVVDDKWEDMPKNEARKKIGQFFRDLNSRRKHPHQDEDDRKLVTVSSFEAF